MYVTIQGTVTFIEDKVQKGKDGKADRAYRVVTLLGGVPGKKPDLIDVKVFNGLKVEKGKEMTIPVNLMAYVRTANDGRVQGAALSCTAAE